MIGLVGVPAGGLLVIARCTLSTVKFRNSFSGVIQVWSQSSIMVAMSEVSTPSGTPMTRRLFLRERFSSSSARSSRIAVIPISLSDLCFKHGYLIFCCGDPFLRLRYSVRHFAEVLLQ